MFEDKKFKILLVGSSSAIIRSSLNNFLDKGLTVIGIANTSKKSSISRNKNYYHYNFDFIKSFKKIDNLCSKISSKHKNISAIIYAQGGSLGKNKILADITDWQKLWKINFGCTVVINNYFIKKFLKQKLGRILYFNSVATNLKYGSAAYSSSKICISDYVKKMGNNFSKSNIYINSISTSIVSEKGNNWNKFEKTAKKKTIKNILKKYLSTQKFGRSNYFVDIVELLCSSRNKFITGSNFDVDGGFLK